MAENIYEESSQETVIQLEATGPPIIIYNGAVISDSLPANGQEGEVLGITQTLPRVVNWVNQIDGGTFN
jgi:hypothetical protein